MRKKFIWILFLTETALLCFFFCSDAFSQSLNQLEAGYNKLMTTRAKEIARLDSLHYILSIRTKEIDEQKKQSNYDEGQVKKLLSASISLSNRIEEEQSRLTETEKELRKTGTQLEQIYSAIIDSLKNAENSAPGASKEKIQEQIIRLTEKKLLAAPQILSLSFNPEKILALNPKGSIKEIERKVATEYLTDALEEVESKLRHTKNTRKEVNQIISLQKKSKKFLEEIDFNSQINRAAVLSGRGSQSVSTDQYGSTLVGEERNLIMQFQTYAYILKQLEIKSLPESRLTAYSNISSGNKKLEIKEYSRLLDAVEKRLNEYKSVLQNKIKKEE